ncbi:MAG: type I-C CRISPR-associated protein Cas8c/Csd1 [Alphaproteobacteria bacterium]|uniref:Type I-C CRISPR-associated protein Cas8c/Csd1 n=1 Tax=Candidatus Nitrobium versatile TaxID=2884831 RepID=A0A953M2G9_9BACT|nr:type I-C CRISPR-associated protein Cas8c/Csd1 [Candidatus Nitrobium versatile]
MIKELSELGKTIRAGKTESELVHDAIKKEPISIEVVIANDGSFREFQLVDNKLTDAEAITAKKGKARLLLDKAEEVLCYGGEKSKKKHELFLDKLSKYQELPELIPVMAFYKQNKVNGVETALEKFMSAFPDEKNRKGNIGFRIESEGNRIHEKAEILKKVIAVYETTQNALLSNSQKNCSVCGKSDYPAEDIPHGMIKRVPDGQSSGCALVSYNENAFESYDLKGNNNSSICTNCAKTYVEGLNWLLSAGNEISIKTKKGKDKKEFRYSNRKNFGSDTAMVFWTRKNKKVEEIDYLEAPNPADVARLIDAVASGTERDGRYLEPDQFYSCTLSGSAARIAVRDWIETSLFDFRRSIAEWFQDIAIAEYDRDSEITQTHYARLYDLARSCQRKNSDGSYDKDDPSLARVATNLWNAALRNTSPPWWILAKVIQRARLDGVTADRAALIKLILNRHISGGDIMITEKIMEGSRPVAYICGQIFAKLESIQYAALGDRNAGIRERYFTYAMTSPASAFGRLFNLNSKHFTKLKSDKPGLAVTLDKELQELCKDVDIYCFPSAFSLEQQGQFAIGYYHQRQLQFSGGK